MPPPRSCWHQRSCERIRSSPTSPGFPGPCSIGIVITRAAHIERFVSDRGTHHCATDRSQPPLHATGRHRHASYRHERDTRGLVGPRVSHAGPSEPPPRDSDDEYPCGRDAHDGEPHARRQVPGRGQRK